MTTFNVNDIVNAAADQDEVLSGKGSFERELPAAGPALLRLKSYLELGVHPNKNNPTYKDTRKVRLTFELHGAQHRISGTKTDGTTYDFPGSISISVGIAGPDSRFGRLFTKMNYDGDATFMYQLLGKAFLGTITHSECGKYANLDANKEWLIGAPVFTNPMDPSKGAQPVPVPEMDGDAQIFLWEKAGLTDAQVKEMWDAIYIDGTREDGTSKNWIQDEIRKSVDFDGSAVSRIDGGAPALDLSAIDGGTDNVTPIVTPDPAPVAEADIDPLKALGL